MSDTIIVTGGAGYIGSHTIVELIQNTDFEVVSIDNYSNSFPKTFDRIEKITGKKVKNYAIDICDKNALDNVFEAEKNVVGIIHFAAFKSVNESVNNPYKYYYNNINSLLNVLECCLKYQISNFIFSSSCSVYGNISNLPVKETTPLGKAESPYGYTKQVGEEIIKDYAKAFPFLQSIALRYFNPVGSHSTGFIGEDPINIPTNLVPVITQTAIGKRQEMQVFGDTYNTRDGSCIRDYIHVTDIAVAHIKAMEHLIRRKNTQNYSVLNLGTGSGVSVFEAIKAFERVTGKKLNYTVVPKRAGDVEAIYSDTTLCENTLHWKPVYSIEDMMQSAWKWELHLQGEAQ
jgi:UDP-glucose 4-epimerase